MSLGSSTLALVLLVTATNAGCLRRCCKRREAGQETLLEGHSLTPVATSLDAGQPLQEEPTAMLAYGGGPGKFNDHAAWFGFQKGALEADNNDALWASLQQDTTSMKAAAVSTFPIPYVPNARATTAAHHIPSLRDDHGALIEVERSDLDEADKERKIIKDSLFRNPEYQALEKQGKFGKEYYYYYGPFESVEHMMAKLKADRMLKPVYAKWLGFVTGGQLKQLEEKQIDFTNLYLQVQWFGWFVRPVVEVTRQQLDALVTSAKTGNAAPAI